MGLSQTRPEIQLKTKKEVWVRYRLSILEADDSDGNGEVEEAWDPAQYQEKKGRRDEGDTLVGSKRSPRFARGNAGNLRFEKELVPFVKAQKHFWVSAPPHHWLTVKSNPPFALENGSINKSNDFSTQIVSPSFGRNDWFSFLRHSRNIAQQQKNEN
jgi:hypothetical protein